MSFLDKKMADELEKEYNERLTEKINYFFHLNITNRLTVEKLKQFQTEAFKELSQ